MKSTESLRDYAPMDVLIVIVSYNTRALLLKCLRSLAIADLTVPHRIVVVDNASQDGSAEAVRAEFPSVRLVENAENVGLARAVNQAWRIEAARYVLVLNPDVEVRPGAITRLLTYLHGHPDVALIAPKLLNPDGTLQYSCRTDYTAATILMRRTCLGRLLPDHRVIRRHLMMDWDHDTTREVDWIVGAAFMVRRDAFTDGTLMDERFFLYFEDVDLCVWLRRQGWRVVYHPASEMVHHHQRASARRGVTREKLEHLKSWMKFAWKHRRTRSVRPRTERMAVKAS